MAGENTITTASGFFKTVYGKELLKATQDFAVLQRRIAFSESEKQLGAYFEQPVSLSYENGFTYNGTGGTVVQLKAAKNAVIKPAQVYGSELVLRAQLADTYISRAVEKGQRAFEKATRFKVQDMDLSIRKRLEIAMLYGQSGIGTVESVADVTPGSVATVVITEATWAGGIWAGAEGVTLDSFTTTTKNNASGILTVTKVNAEDRTLTVTYTGTLASEITAGDVLYFESANAGSSTFNEMAGLQKIISNTGSLFNIDAATYSLWKGTTHASFGALTFQKLQLDVAKAVNKGLMEKCLVLVSPKGWSSMQGDMSALRMLDSSYNSKKMENGAESIKFYSQNGELEVVAHPMVKDGDMFCLPEKSIQRVGSCDVTFGLSGGDEKFFTWLPDYNAVEMRCKTDQAIFLDRPAHAVFASGITY